MTDELTRRRFLGTASTAVAGGVAVGAASAGAAEAVREDSIKIVAICCSPRKDKTTATSLQVCLDAASEVDDRIIVELIQLAEMRIDGSVAAGRVLEPGERDDFPSLVPKLSDPSIGGIIIGTPVYFANMSSLCKAFLERCTVFRKNDYAWANKVGGVLAVGGSRSGGQELTIRSVQTTLMAGQQMLVVGDAPPTGHFGATLCSGTEGGVTKDEFGMSTARNLGRRVAELALRLAGKAE